MPKRKETKDANEIAFAGLQELLRRDEVRDKGESIEDTPEKNPAAVALGRLGGLKGGKARAKKLSPERRKEIAKKAIESRWAKDKA
jgi:hypothetical protein